ACTEAGHRAEIVSCGGTGTFPYCLQQAGVTEVQVGGAIFSDMHYLAHYHVDFAPALTVLATVSSRPTPTRIVVDAGKKTMSGDAAMPEPRGLPPIAAIKLSAEHTKIELQHPSEAPKVGERIEFIVGSSDTTIKQIAARQDAGKWVVLVLCLLAATASLVVIATEMPQVKNASGLGQAARVVLVIYTIVLSWAFSQTVFALHYAHDYYLEVDLPAAMHDPGSQRLVFPGEKTPTYGDF